MRYTFRLYIAGRTPRSLRAIANLQALGEEGLGGNYEWEVIDVLENCERAEEERVLATPTLIKVSPAPVRRFIGDLSAWEQLVEELEIPGTAKVLPFARPGRKSHETRSMVGDASPAGE